MKRVFITLSLLITATASHAASFKTVSCWKGFNNAEQQANLVTCKNQIGANQKCSANWNEHQNAVYDVCLIEPTSALRVISLFKDYSQRDQDTNSKQCDAQVAAGQICISDWSVHGGGVYDVGLME